MKIRMRIEKVAALKAGKDQYGYCVVEVPAANLSQQQREVLTRCEVKPSPTVGPDADFYLDGLRGAVEGATSALGAIPEATPETVIQAIDAMLDLYAEEAVRKAAAEAAQAESREREILKILAAPPETFITETRHVSDGWYDTVPGNDRVVTPKFVAFGLAQYQSDPRIQELAGRVATILDERNAARKAGHDARVEAEREKVREREAAAARRGQQIDDWVAAHGTPLQTARHAEGFLPEEEVVDVIREEAFAPLADWAKYKRIERSEVCTCGDEYPSSSCKLECEVEDADSLTDTEYQRLTECRRLMPAATVKPRLHRCSGSECDSTEERLSLHVSVTVGAFEFSREYAL